MSASDLTKNSSPVPVIGKSDTTTKETGTNGPEKSLTGIGEDIFKNSFQDIGVNVQDILTQSVMGFLDISVTERTSREDGEKIKSIVTWLDGQQGDRVEKLWKLRSLESRLGTPRLGETRLSQLARWIHLDLQQQSIQKEKALYER